MNLTIRPYWVNLLALTLLPFSYAEALPQPDHVVIVMEENHGYAQIMDKRYSASYIHSLVKRGALFTQSYGITHPSQPNYLALFSGSVQGVAGNTCPYSFDTDNLASSLLDAGFSFSSFSESLPATGDLICMSGAYQRKHNPAANWQGTRLPARVNRTFADFPKDYSTLPTVSLVVPNQNNDMHDGSFETADDWLRINIAPFVDWAMTHNSLLILTWDEDDNHEGNHVVTLLIGQMVYPGVNSQRINHYTLLRTLLDFYDLPAVGASRDEKTIKGIWKKR
jgi:acid phosphatase